MGLLKFALRGNYKRYYNDLKELSKKNHKSAFLMFVDTAISCVIFKSGLQDYLNYKFYDKSFKERSTYATIGYQHKFYLLAANYEYAPFFSNKVNFNHNFKKFVKRECRSYQDGLEEITKFIKEHKEIVRKPISGLGGANVEKIETKNIKNIKEFYENLNKDNCLIEELIIQNKEWEVLNPGSINTVRVVTKCVDGKSDILFAAVRIGSGNSLVDNFHSGGVGVNVNIEKGILEGKAIDKKNRESDYTPTTKVKVDGFVIPYWKEIIKMTKEAAKVNDDVNVVGWDVAITENGPLIIEGNRGPGMDLIQVLLNRGVKPDLEAVKKEILSSKKYQEKRKKR